MTNFPPPIHTSGKKREYETGAQRDNREGKGRYDLISPLALRRLAIHLERGAKHYGDRNWEKGIPLSDLCDSALRHLFQWLSGSRNEDHLAATAFNVFAMIHMEDKIADGSLPPSLADGLPTTSERPPVTPRASGADDSLALAGDSRQDSARASHPTLADDPVIVEMVRRAYARGVEKVARPRVKPSEGSMRIYVAGPYTGDGEQTTKNHNVAVAESIGQKLFAKGHKPHVPHTLTHPFDHHKNGPDASSWWVEEYDLDYIRYLMDAVYRIPGDSPGADREVTVAENLGLPIFHSLNEVPDANPASA